MERRALLIFGLASVAGRAAVSRRRTPGQPGPEFPRQEAELVREVVGASHGNLARVRELVTARPALAKASVDWGFGDWESALEAAAHTGRREIAELLLTHGARPTLFSAAMLGQLDVVRTMVEASPGIQGTLGPHSITLLAHARAGGEPARAVREYLERVGGADLGPALAPLDPGVRARYLGSYAFGGGPTERLEVVVERDALMIRRSGGTARTLRHLGGDAFFPVGAEAVRVRFSGSGSVATTLTVHDPDIVVTATRI